MCYQNYQLDDRIQMIAVSCMHETLAVAACRIAYSLLAEVEAIRRIHARQIEVRTLTYSYKLIDSSSIVRQHRRRVSHLA
jgi:hypothetical protein